MIRQFDKSENSINGYGILIAEHFDDAVIFNESYIVFGDFVSDENIHACYDLTVFGNISAEKITVNGCLKVFGNMTSDYVEVQKNIFCSGDVIVKELIVYSNIYAKSINSVQILCGDKMIVDETINIDKLCEVDNIMVACEGIIGSGILKVKNAVANDYFEFTGSVDGKVIEIYAMGNKLMEVTTPYIVEQQKSIDDCAFEYAKVYSDIQNQISNISLTEDEEQLLGSLSKFAIDKVSFNNILSQFKLIIEYSYKHDIDNIYDYLIIVKADNELPMYLKKYETVSGVFEVIFENAKGRLNELRFYVNSSFKFAEAINIATQYQNYLGQDFEYIMDAIFLSIGIKYNTVKNVLSEG